MAKKVRIQKKKIWKGPDEFISTSNKVFNYVLENQRNIIKLAIVFLIGVLFFVGWRVYSERTEREASNLYYEAIRYYHGDDGAKSPVKDDKERYNIALKRFKDLLENYPRTSIVPMAFLYCGHIYYKLKEFDKSIQSYQDFLKRTPSDSSLRVFAFDGSGCAYEAKGDYKNALKYFRKLVDGNKNPLSKLGYLNIGKCYEELEEKNKAIETYQQMLATYPNSGYAAWAKERIRILQRDAS